MPGLAGRFGGLRHVSSSLRLAFVLAVAAALGACAGQPKKAEPFTLTYETQVPPNAGGRVLAGKAFGLSVIDRRGRFSGQGAVVVGHFNKVSNDGQRSSEPIVDLVNRAMEVELRNLGAAVVPSGSKTIVVDITAFYGWTLSRASEPFGELRAVGAVTLSVKNGDEAMEYSKSVSNVVVNSSAETAKAIGQLVFGDQSSGAQPTVHPRYPKVFNTLLANLLKSIFTDSEFLDVLRAA